MNPRKSDRRPPGKSKTDLRRGNFTPGFPLARNPSAPQDGSATSRDEQSLLFDAGGGAK